MHQEYNRKRPGVEGSWKNLCSFEGYCRHRLREQQSKQQQSEPNSALWQSILDAKLEKSLA
jgi:hypothetical protein